MGGVAIYHIGSTAIPGSIAKPIIDIGIVSAS
ncbi:GrpB family protein [Vibrio vulnificus]